MYDVETLIIGGGQAGLALSYYLSQERHENLVLEKAAKETAQDSTPAESEVAIAGTPIVPVKPKTESAAAPASRPSRR